MMTGRLHSRKQRMIKFMTFEINKKKCDKGVKKILNDDAVENNNSIGKFSIGFSINKYDGKTICRLCVTVYASNYNGTNCSMVLFQHRKQIDSMSQKYYVNFVFIVVQQPVSLRICV